MYIALAGRTGSSTTVRTQHVLVNAGQIRARVLTSPRLQLQPLLPLLLLVLLRVRRLLMPVFWLVRVAVIVLVTLCFYGGDSPSIRGGIGIDLISPEI